MTITYEEIIPSPIENAVVKKGFADGVHRTHTAEPMDGYLLHDKALDYEDFDIETETAIPMLGFTAGMRTVGYNYDFAANAREFYTVPENTIPENQIFGGGDNNDHEVM